MWLVGKRDQFRSLKIIFCSNIFIHCMYVNIRKESYVVYHQPNKIIAWLTFPKWLVLVCTIRYVIMNVANRNQSLVKSEICHYFIRLTIYNRQWNKMLYKRLSSPWYIYIPIHPHPSMILFIYTCKLHESVHVFLLF